MKRMRRKDRMPHAIAAIEAGERTGFLGDMIIRAIPIGT
jgi:hypothetical protein